MICLVSPTTVMAFVPHQFWSRPKAITTPSSTRIEICQQRRSSIGTTLSMYFDDCERSKEIEERLRNSFLENNISPRDNTDNNNPWIISQSDEKREALEKFLGYNPKSASELTDEQVEEETLRWVVNTDIVWTGDDDESSSDSNQHDVQGSIDRRRVTTIRYDSINDLLVASSCDSTAQSLAFLWDKIAEALEDATSATPNVSSSRNSVKLIVFPKLESLWDYDTMVTMLEAIQITRPLLPNNFELGLDLFHPNFKHSPRMWSPQWHSPFPTVGITIKAKKQESIDDIDLDTVRGKLDVLFQSVDATREDAQNSDEDHQHILKDCQSWLFAENDRTKSKAVEFNPKSVETNDVDWMVQSIGSPSQLYRTLWNSVLSLSAGGKSASVVIDPFLDSSTLHRVAVTVNAALIRLDIPIRITELYHPFARAPSSNSSCKTRPPHGMILLSPIH